MKDKLIQAILQCPISGTRLIPVPEVENASLIEKAKAGALVYLPSQSIDQVDQFLKSEHHEIYYTVRSGIVQLLPSLAIMSPEAAKSAEKLLTHHKTLAVMEFYDRQGWQLAESGVYVDADINEDFRKVSKRYVNTCHMRVLDHLPKRGKYLLDIASGPIQYDEYLCYSTNFEKRLCCDVSFRALLAAKRRISDHGVFIQCDITQLPFRSAALDGFVCLHTIYHVPADQQACAFTELMRVTRPSGSGVVVYAWPSNPVFERWRDRVVAVKSKIRAIAVKVAKTVLPHRLWSHVRTAVARKAMAQAQTHEEAASSHSYYAHNLRWFTTTVGAQGHWTIYVWRSVDPSFLKALPNTWVGSSVLFVLNGLERLFPGLAGRFGRYPMLVFRNTEGQS